MSDKRRCDEADPLQPRSDVLANLIEGWWGTSEERVAIHKNNYPIDALKATSTAFNPEVFLYPVWYTFVLAVMMFVLSCSFRYRYGVAMVTVAVVISIVLILHALHCLYRAVAIRAGRSVEVYYLIMLSVTLGLGWHFGEDLYQTLFRPFYAYDELKMYRDIDPKTQPGSRYTDGGVVYFAPGTTLKRDMNACLKNDHHYCVAPIMNCPFDDCSDIKTETGSYDYFAIGKDCCGCPEGEFRCGDWNNPLAHGGLRLLDQEELLYYRLAVKQWEATWNLTSRTPLFFDWDLRPQRKAKFFDDTGYAYMLFGSCVYCVLQIMLSMALDFGKII